MIRPTFNRPVLYTSFLSEQFRGVEGNHPVYSTVVSDEFTMRTPDALMSGLATMQIIENCCPDIIDAKQLPISDIQHILVSIKIATQGPNFEFNITCPKCNSNDPYEANLQKSIAVLSAKKWYLPFKVNDLILVLNPPSYETFTEFSIFEFQLSKQIFTLSKLNEPEKYGSIMAALLEKKRKLEEQYYLSCIKSIEIYGHGAITNQKFISEWFHQCEVDVRRQITDYIEEAKKECSVPDMKITCSECSYQFTVPIDLDFCTHFRKKLISANEEDILAIIKGMGEDTKSITDDLLKMIWYMRGAISYTEAYNLTNFERKCIAKIIENNLEITKKTGLAVV